MIAICFIAQFTPTSDDFLRLHLAIDRHCLLVEPISKFRIKLFEPMWSVCGDHICTKFSTYRGAVFKNIDIVNVFCFIYENLYSMIYIMLLLLLHKP